ncbi:MAG TPA: NAD(P)H-hydrate dehydratase [Acidimicrobiia bacterium]|nr:NAD(P)H-hydrate dehydratase [Acidimicrobiia bacterium]
MITPAEAARLDDSAGVAVDVLMERAGRAVALAAVRMGAGYGTRVTVLAGPGNNGGDGYVAARLLRQRGVGVGVLALADPRTRPALAMRGRAHASAVPISPMVSPHRTDLVIDALFGGGWRSGLPAVVKDWMEVDAPVLAVDVPSGLDPGTGEVEEAAFRAQQTVTFHAHKTGHVLGAGPDHTGRVTVADIGLKGGSAELLLCEETDAPRPRRVRRAHKWSAGSVLVVGGSPGMTGAAIMAGRAALRFGAGAVGVAVPNKAFQVAAAAAPELLHYTTEELPDRFDVLVVGPGLGKGHDELVARLLGRWQGPVVVDADALDGVGTEPGGGGLVLTPHAGEFTRITGKSPSYPGAGDLARSLQATVLLKGNPTIVTDGTSPWVVDTGGPELATIGTGDVLAGMVAALLAAGLKPVAAARSAAYWHGRAGADLARTATVTAIGLLEQVGKTV